MDNNNITIGAKYRFKAKNEVEEKYLSCFWGEIQSFERTDGNKIEILIAFCLENSFFKTGLFWKGDYGIFCRDWEILKE